MILKRNLIFLPALLMDMSTNSAILAMTFYASKLGASPLVIGMTASASTLLYVIFSRIFGKLSDRVGRKRVPQIAALCFSILYFLMPNFKSLPFLVAFFPLTGFFISAFWPPYEAWIGEISDGRPLEKRVRMFNLAWATGVMIGNVMSGYFYELDHRIPFYFASAGSFIAFMIISLHSKPVMNHKSENVLEHFENNEADIPPHIRKKFLYISWVAIFFTWITLGVLRYIFPKLISDLLMPPRYFGLLMFTWAGTQVFLFYILGATKRWHYRIEFSIICQLLGCVGFIIIFLTNYPIFWAFALMLFGIQTGMVYFSSIYYSLCGHADAGNKSGWHESILSSGGFFGPFIAGALAKYVGIKSPYMFCVSVILVGLLTQFLLIKSNWFNRKIGGKQNV
ncbi:MAG: MFS transporter [Candidatus Poribacteria bacterium]